MLPHLLLVVLLVGLLQFLGLLCLQFVIGVVFCWVGLEGLLTWLLRLQSMIVGCVGLDDVGFFPWRLLRRLPQATGERAV